MNNRIITIIQGKRKVLHRTKGRNATVLLAQKFAKNLQGGSVVALVGELGCGKTVFASGIAQGLGIRKTITSPTFALMVPYALPKGSQRVYHAKQLCHIDTYRLSKESDFFEIGIQDYVGSEDTITVVEWPEKLKNFLSPKTIYIHIETVE